MQLDDKRSKSSRSFSDNDFSDILHKSRFDRFGSALRVITAVMVIVGLGVGGLWIYGNSSQTSVDNKSPSMVYRPIPEASSAAREFNTCSRTATDKTKDLQTSDSDFSKKLISGYDEWLACYDKYPKVSVNATPGKSSLELARQSAIDSAGSYKNTYLSSSPYDYRPSSYSSSSYSYDNTGDTPPTPNEPRNQPADTTTVDANWCKAKKAEINNLDTQYRSARNAVDAIDTKISKIDADVRQRTGGSSLNESQIQAMINSEKDNLEVQKTNLVSQQSIAKSKYDSAQYEYHSKSCT